MYMYNMVGLLKRGLNHSSRPSRERAPEHRHSQRDLIMQLTLGAFLATFLLVLLYPSLRTVLGGSVKLKFCMPCIGDECNMVPEEDCLYGLVKNHCGNWECGRGPGQTCGGPSKIFGECGDGMHCKCDRCVGCSSKTLDCELNTAIC